MKITQCEEKSQNNKMITLIDKKDRELLKLITKHSNESIQREKIHRSFAFLEKLSILGSQSVIHDTGI